MSESLRIRRLVEYLKKNSSKGYTLESLKWALIKQGYQRIEVFRAVEIANQELAEKAPKLEDKPIVNYELYDQNNKLVQIKKPWWKKIFGV
jgi:hypothetical protein